MKFLGRASKVTHPVYGAIYHVLNRGDRREDIFHKAEARRLFLKTLGEACAKTGWQVHAYCLMRNHFHLVLETPRPNLVAGMQWLMRTYTTRFNRRHRLYGHLFGGRYKAQLVDGSGDGYLRTACDYVHLNPLRAKDPSAEGPADLRLEQLSMVLDGAREAAGLVARGQAHGRMRPEGTPLAGAGDWRKGWKSAAAKSPVTARGNPCGGVGVWATRSFGTNCWRR